jgi:putative peptide zinc metalloprotease protein
MRFGPTSLQTSKILAKGQRRAAFRTSLRVSEQVFAGEVSYMVKVPESTDYYRLTPYEYELIQLFDGSRTPGEVAQEITARYPASPLSEQSALEYLDQADPNLFERSQEERNLAVLEKIRQERKGRAERSNIFYFVVRSWESDKFLNRVYPYLRWMFTPAFVIFCVCLFAVMAGLIATDYSRIQQDTVNFYRDMYDSWYNFWIFWVLMFFVIGLHEMGHGLTCKHFGGEVPHMGMMFIYFNPAFYTDVTDMCLFDKTRKRLWTIFAGLWTEMIICSFASLAWYFSRPGSLLNVAGYQVLLFTGISALFFNLNPFIKFDGYYALSTYLEVEGLSESANQYLWAWIRKNLFRHPVEMPPATRRRRRILLTYSTLAFMYRALAITFFLFFLKSLFTSRFGGTAGTLLTVGLLYFILRKRIRKTVPFVRAEIRALKERLMKWKMSQGQLVGAAIVAAFLIVPIAPDRVSTEFLLEPGARAGVRATAPGVVAQVNVHEGDSVEAGNVLAVLHNPELEARAAVLSHELEESEHSLMGAQASNDRIAIAKAQQDTKRLDTALNEARVKLAGLTLRSPISGIVTTPQIGQKIGSYVGEGDEFAVVADRRQMKARVLVHDLDIQDVQPGALVKLKVRANPFHTYSGYIEQIMPAAASDQPVNETQKLERYGQALANYFAVTLELPNSNGELREGMTGTAKIFGKRTPLIYRAGRGVWRWLSSQIW